jgi:hypothetical protein
MKTTLQEEIERQKADLASFEKDRLRNPDGAIDFDYAIKSTQHTISVLESMLPKEEEQMIKFGIQARYIGREDKDYDLSVKEFFTQQFKNE